MTTMDLWYDLAIRERPAPDAGPIEPCELEDAKKSAPEPLPTGPVAVDFF
jgi:hypothetical protein